MFHRERFAIHLISEDRVRIERFCERKRTLEVRHGSEWDICPVEKNLACGCFQARALEHIGQTNAAPARVPHGSVAPLQSRDRRLIESPAVPGAFENAYKL